MNSGVDSFDRVIEKFCEICRNGIAFPIMISYNDHVAEKDSNRYGNMRV